MVSGTLRATCRAHDEAGVRVADAGGNSLKAPAMQVCESVPNNTYTGRVWPRAGSAV
jgi:hypothetical protein